MAEQWWDHRQVQTAAQVQSGPLAYIRDKAIEHLGSTRASASRSKA
jgi:hypothetical protein